ncbi:hypothetical protein [Saccharospirillum mangrovi]|uniref:hypothetical protein n=1 Tax=Saccharospirillum mangrovi TaxID=2161747 RepID=UPI000D35A7D7|nr:hypothetical protein [Saccharospirillum mangrovi]
MFDQRITLFLGALLPVFAWADDLPGSIQKWLDQDEFFWSLDFSNGTQAKQDLISYYRSVFQDDLLAQEIEWVQGGNFESEYYSSYFSDLNDQVLLSTQMLTEVQYEVRLLQTSCYVMTYNAPRMETVVADYKIINLSQAEVDQWVEDQGFPPSGKICMEIINAVSLGLDSNSNLIISVQKQRMESTAELISEL